MKVIDGFHPAHFEYEKYEKLTGRTLSPEISGKGSTQKIYMFPNGYGASVIQGFMSFGYPELAVIQFENPVRLYRSKSKRLKKKAYKKAGPYSLTYETPISDDVKRYEDMRELQRDLSRIAKLKPDGEAYE